MTNNIKQRIFLSPPHMGGQELEYVREAFDSNYIAPLGPMVDKFEQAFSNYTGIPHCVALNSGTAALHLAMRHLGVQSGDAVFASTFTFIGSVTPILFQSANPVFIDSSEDTWCMDPALLEEALIEHERQGRLPKAVIPTDLYGQCSDYHALQSICDKYGIPLVVDAAEAMGAAYQGRHAGCAGRAAAYSFNGNKIITTSGGGVLASQDEELIAHARKLSQQSRDPFPHYEHSEYGYNYRMSNILAAIGIGQIEVLDERVKKRREIFETYRSALLGQPGIQFMPEAPYGQANRWLTVITVDKALCGATSEEIRNALESEGIESRPVWKPMHLQPIFTGACMYGGEVSRRIYECGLCLPSGTNMTSDQLIRVIETIKNCLRK